MFKRCILIFEFLIWIQILAIGSGQPPIQSSQGSGSSYSETLDNTDDINKGIPDIQMPIQDIKTGCQIFVMDAGQGNFIIVKNHDNKTIAIIDAGSSTPEMNFSRFYTENQVLLDNIFEKDFTVNCIFITHTDKDHYNFFKDSKKTNNFVRDFWKSKINPNCIVVIGGGTSKDEPAILLGNFSVKIYRVLLQKNDCIYRSEIDADNPQDCQLSDVLDAVNTSFSKENNCSFKLLETSDGYGNKNSKNTQSLLLLLQGDGGNVLFTGDATLASINAVRNKKELNCVNFLVIPHHGAKTAGSPDVSKIVISEAAENFIGGCVSANPGKTSTRYNHPQKDGIPEMGNYSALDKHKKIIIAYVKKKLKKYYTHRRFFEPGMLAGRVLWIKLEKGLSIFDNKEYAAYYQANDSSSPVDYFIPQTVLLNGHIYSTYTYLQNFENLIMAEDDGILKTHFEQLFSSNSASIFNENFWENLSEDCKKKLEKLNDNVKIKLGYNSIPRVAMEAVQIATSFEEFNVAQKDDLIAEILPGYQLRDVLVDGNCGIWALLQILNPQKKYNDKNSLTQEDKRTMIFYRNLASTIAEQCDASEKTINRIKFFGKDGHNEIPEDVTVPQGNYIVTDDFLFFSKLLGYPITIIRSDGNVEEYGQDEVNKAKTLYLYFDKAKHHYQALL